VFTCNASTFLQEDYQNPATESD